MKYSLLFLAFTLVNIVAKAQATTTTDSVEEQRVYTKVDKECQFKGSWRDFLVANLNPDVPGKHGAPVGTYTTIIQFIVMKDGSLSDIKCIKDPGFGIAKEAIRVIKLSPKWMPGIQNGHPVNSLHQQPFTFVVQL